MRELMNQDLKAITEAHSAPMISIYLSKDNGILDKKTLNEKWKESLQKAEYFLLKDYTRSFVNSFMEPLWLSDCLEKLETLDKGLIVFFSPNEVGYLRVQTSINDLVVVADSFHIKPLLRIKNNERGFFLVTMSAKAVNVFVETNGHLYRLETYRNIDTLEGSKKIAPKDFLVHTSNELNKMFATYRFPIILAGVKEYLGLMRNSLEHSMILEESITGNVEKIKADNLRQRSFEILVPYYKEKELEAVQELNTAVKKNHAITYIEDIAVSAVYGKVKKLFVVENKQIWGAVNKLTGEVFIFPKQTNSHDDDILDDICQIVLARGGEVVVLKDANNVKGFIAAAIVTDRSHLYDGNMAYSIPG